MLDGLVEARQAVRDHDQSAREARRLERVDMAVRLVRWLGERSQQAGVEPKSLAVAADEHLRDGGFVDWARSEPAVGRSGPKSSRKPMYCFSRP